MILSAKWRSSIVFNKPFFLKRMEVSKLYAEDWKKVVNVMQKTNDIY